MSTQQDAVTLYEGRLRYRKGKKWRNRWAVLSRTSPVADKLLLVFSKEQGKKGKIKEGCNLKVKSQTRLEDFCGLLSGLEIDGCKNVLVIVCMKTLVMLGFETKYPMVEWEIKIRQVFGEEHQFTVSSPLGSGKKNFNKNKHCVPAVMCLHSTHFALTAFKPPRIMGVWQLSNIIRYGPIKNGFMFVSNGKHSRNYYVKTPSGESIADAFDHVTGANKHQNGLYKSRNSFSSYSGSISAAASIGRFRDPNTFGHSSTNFSARPFSPPYMTTPSSSNLDYATCLGFTEESCSSKAVSTTRAWPVTSTSRVNALYDSIDGTRTLPSTKTPREVKIHSDSYSVDELDTRTRDESPHSINEPFSVDELISKNYPHLYIQKPIEKPTVRCRCGQRLTRSMPLLPVEAKPRPLRRSMSVAALLPESYEVEAALVLDAECGADNLFVSSVKEDACSAIYQTVPSKSTLATPATPPPLPAKPPTHDYENIPTTPHIVKHGTSISSGYSLNDVLYSPAVHVKKSSNSRSLMNRGLPYPSIRPPDDGMSISDSRDDVFTSSSEDEYTEDHQYIQHKSYGMRNSSPSRPDFIDNDFSKGFIQKPTFTTPYETPKTGRATSANIFKKPTLNEYAYGDPPHHTRSYVQTAMGTPFDYAEKHPKSISHQSDFYEPCINSSAYRSSREYNPSYNHILNSPVRDMDSVRSTSRRSSIQNPLSQWHFGRESNEFSSAFSHKAVHSNPYNQHTYVNLPNPYGYDEALPSNNLGKKTPLNNFLHASGESQDSHHSRVPSQHSREESLGSRSDSFQPVRTRQEQLRVYPMRSETHSVDSYRSERSYESSPNNEYINVNNASNVHLPQRISVRHKSSFSGGESYSALKQVRPTPNSSQFPRRSQSENRKHSVEHKLNYLEFLPPSHDMGSKTSSAAKKAASRASHVQYAVIDQESTRALHRTLEQHHLSRELFYSRLRQNKEQTPRHGSTSSNGSH